MNDIHKQLVNVLGPRVKEGEPLGRYTTFKIGGPADYFFEAKTVTDIVNAIHAARDLEVPVYILGGGTNLLIGDKGIRGLVIKNNTNTIAIRGMKGTVLKGESKRLVYVEADSGVVFNRLVRFTVDEGLAGLQMHLGLPGSVGGAIYMNSKWTHPEGFVGDVVYQAEILTQSLEQKLVPRSYFHFGYDTSEIQKTGDIVLRVVFALTTVSKERLWQIANQSISYRRETQPQGILSAGCTFQNVTKAEALTHSTPNHTTSAGLLLDKAGLKGTREGDAQISTQHANFIINNGKATASDVVKLITRAKEQVKAQFGITLREEIVRVGEF
jgi:UDP-N-acetylenolpyruvoylglucosamine reductase